MTSTNFNVIKTELSWAVQATMTFINIVHNTKLNANKYKNLTLTERAEISQNPPVGRCQSAAHSPITEGNTAAPGGGKRMLLLHSHRLVSQEALTLKLIVTSLASAYIQFQRYVVLLGLP